MKRKVAVWVSALMLVFASYAFASSLVFLAASDGQNFYLERESLTYSADTKIINSWIKVSKDDASDYLMINYLFNTQTLQMKPLKIQQYDKAGHLKKDNEIKQDWEPIGADENLVVYKKILACVEQDKKN